MQTIIDLWNGNIAPCERCGAHDPKLGELIALMERNRAALSIELTDKQQEIFEKFIDCSEEYLITITEMAFADGFCLAAKLLTESLS